MVLLLVEVTQVDYLTKNIIKHKHVVNAYLTTKQFMVNANDVFLNSCNIYDWVKVPVELMTPLISTDHKTALYIKLSKHMQVFFHVCYTLDSGDN